MRRRKVAVTHYALAFECLGGVAWLPSDRKVQQMLGIDQVDIIDDQPPRVEAVMVRKNQADEVLAMAEAAGAKYLLRYQGEPLLDRARAILHRAGDRRGLSALPSVYYPR